MAKAIQPKFEDIIPPPEPSIGLELAGCTIVGPVMIGLDPTDSDDVLLVTIDPRANPDRARILRTAMRRRTPLAIRVLSANPSREHLARVDDLEDNGPDGLLTIRFVYLGRV